MQFKGLRYSYLNEDPNLEFLLVRKRNYKKILSVCGSGLRSFYLALAHPLDMTLIDSNPVQIEFAAIHYRTLLEFDFESYHRFWGTPGFSSWSHHQRIQTFPLLKQYLKMNEAPLFCGSHERGLISRAKISKLLLKNKNSLLVCSWKLKCALLACEPVLQMLKFMHKIPPSEKGWYFPIYREWIAKLEENIDQSKFNWLHQQVFWGTFRFKEAHLLHDPDIFHQLKTNLIQSKITFIECNLTDFKDKKNHFEFISASNVFSHLSEEQSNRALKCLFNCLEPDGRALLRLFLHSTVHYSENQWKCIAIDDEMTSHDRTSLYRFLYLEKNHDKTTRTSCH